jgi:hypothetical protein
MRLLPLLGMLIVLRRCPPVKLSVTSSYCKSDHGLVRSLNSLRLADLRLIFRPDVYVEETERLWSASGMFTRVPATSAWSALKMFNNRGRTKP